MAYKFLDVIDDIVAGLNDRADKAEQEQEEINTRQAELKAELAALEPRLLRAHTLKSRDDLICADCFINHDVVSPLKCMAGDRDVDRFRCGKCGEEYASNF